MHLLARTKPDDHSNSGPIQIAHIQSAFVNVSRPHMIRNVLQTNGLPVLVDAKVHPLSKWRPLRPLSVVMVSDLAQTRRKDLVY